MGANHTFSMTNEGTGVNKELGSGITIMGYAGITSQDLAPHSIDIYHEASIAQIQANLATKTCPVTTSISAIMQHLLLMQAAIIQFLSVHHLHLPVQLQMPTQVMY